jgi:CO/xanthine dehydrogenase Mo-binding subunit
VEFRLRHTKDARSRGHRGDGSAGALGSSRQGDGRYGRGFAFSRYKNLGCYCATVAEVEVDRASRRVRVSRVVAAVDAGEIVNPDGVVNQIEGGIIQSASWTLKESVRFDRTRVTTRSWADYPILRFDEVPEVDVNAIAHATGRRLRALPFTPDVVKAALA